MNFKRKKVAVVSGAFDNSVRSMFRMQGFDVVDPLKAEHVDAIVFTGGHDLCASMYKEKPLPNTYSLPQRDAYETSLFEMHHNLPKIGICRGGQLLNVLSGGKMWQDTDNHEGSHEVTTSSGQKFVGSSLHHQMMRPTDKAVVLLTADVSNYVVGEKEMKSKDVDVYDDIEAVFYPETQSLCYQGHPEIGRQDERDYFFHIIAEHLNL